MKYLTLTLCGLYLVLGLFLQPAVAEPQGTLRIALTTMPNALVLPIGAERQAHNAAWPLYDSLLWVNEEGKVVPALAETWDVSEDGTQYVFTLRQGVTFHNGEAFNADSVVFSWDYARQDKMQWGEKWTIASAVEKIDEYTVRVTTEKPNALLLRIMADHWTMLPPKYFAEVGEDGLLTHPIGTGPFMFVEWQKGDRIVYEANPNYWQAGYPKVKTVIFRPIPESSTRVAAIQTGEVDIVSRLSAEEAESLQGVPGVNVVKYPVDRVYYIAFNNLTTGKGQPTEDPRVRQAMNYAIDVDVIIDALFNGAGSPSSGYVTPGNWGYDKEITPFGYDPEKAVELLTEAGYADGFEMDFACPAGAYANFEQVCEAIQGFLGEVGIQTNLELMESGKYWDMEAKKDLPPLFGDSWSETTGEALPRLRGALGGMDASFSAWSDPTIDDYLDKIGRTLDADARAQLYVELQRFMQDNPPFIYLYQPVTFEAIKPTVKDYTPRPGEDYFLKAVSITE